MKKTCISLLSLVLTLFVLTGCGCRNSKPAQTMPTTLPTVTTAPTTEATTLPATMATIPTDATIQDGNGPLPEDDATVTQETEAGRSRNHTGSGTGITGSITG